MKLLFLLVLSLNISAQITSTDGLENLTSIDGNLIISETQITNLDGFIALENVSGDVIIKNNSLLTSYCGLKNLFENGTVGGKTTIEGNQVDLDTANLDFSACDSSLSLSENTADTFIVYPNPVIDYINFSDTKNIKSIAIYNVLGGLVFFEETDFDNINLSNIASGYYTLKTTNLSNKTTTTKLIKQ